MASPLSRTLAVTVVQTPARHAHLFELLRQQNLANHACNRIAARRSQDADAKASEMFLKTASRSWQRPGLPAGPGQVMISAAKAAGHHKFFRAIRAR
jgi:hypothetical protein